MKTETHRAERVAELIREELSRMLVRGEVKDPGSRGAVVTGVRLSADLSKARVFVRSSADDADSGRRTIDALTRASSFLRRSLAARLRLRRTPALLFVWDESVDSASRIEDLLDELRVAEEGPES